MELEPSRRSSQLYVGQFQSSSQIRFERIFPVKIETLWKFLTDEELLPLWIADSTIDLRVGGDIEYRFRESDDPEGFCKGENVSGGKILELVPPTRLVFEFSSPHAGLTKLSYLLRQDGELTELTLIHSDLPPDLMVAFAAGWHCYLSALGARLADMEPEEFAPQFELKIRRYTVILALSAISTTTLPSEGKPDDAAYARLTDDRVRLLTKFDRLAKDEDDLNWEILQKRKSGTRDAEEELDYLVKDLKKVQREIDKLELDIRDNSRALL